MKQSLVAINIIVNGKLINKNNIPICYYWDNKTDIKEALKNDNSFKTYIIDNICNIENYTNASIAVMMNTNDSEADVKDSYYEFTADIQEWYCLNDLSEDTGFYEEYLIKHMNYLYNCVYKVDFEFQGGPFIKEDLKSIYEKIRNKYDEQRVNRNTVINYIRSQLLTTDKLNTQNTEFILKKLTDII